MKDTPGALGRLDLVIFLKEQLKANKNRLFSFFLTERMFLSVSQRPKQFFSNIPEQCLRQTGDLQFF